MMIKKKILDPKRIRRIDGSFSFIPHRFLTDGHLASLSQHQLLLYLFLVLASDRYGLSFYSYDAILGLLELTVEQYIEARNALIEKQLIAFDGTIFQVLDLPEKPMATQPSSADSRTKAPVGMAEIVKQTLNNYGHDKT
jgi:hypothetical protein